MNETPLSIVFLGSVLPEGMCSAQPACSVAANRDIQSLITAIKDAAGTAPTILSVQPIGMYPKTRQLLVGYRHVQLTDELDLYLVPFLNVPLFKQVTIALANSICLAVWLWKHRDHQRRVIVHNVYPPMSLPVLLATKLLGGCSIALVMDLPHNMSHDFRGRLGKLRKLNYVMETRLLAAFTGIIGYTRLIGADFAPQTPLLVMEGGVDADSVIPPANVSDKDRKRTERIVCFSGSLTSINGVELLLDAFQLLPDSDIRLWVFGRGPLEELVSHAAMRDTRITFFGFVSDHTEVMRRQQCATVLVNLRLSSDTINRYTFPSKLREYMLSGRPVITTETPGIPREYYDHVYPLHSETPAELARLLYKTCTLPSETLEEFGENARDFVLRNKNWEVQGERVFEFIRKLPCR